LRVQLAILRQLDGGLALLAGLGTFTSCYRQHHEQARDEPRYLFIHSSPFLSKTVIALPAAL